MTNKDQTVQLNFEVLDSNEENVIFKRIVKDRHRSNKDKKNIQDSLPTATMHYISEFEYNKLKKIEADLIIELQNEMDEPSFFMNIRHHLFRFLEL